MAPATSEKGENETAGLPASFLLPAGASGGLRKGQLTASRSRTTPLCDPHPPFLGKDIGEEMSRGDASKKAASEGSLDEKASCCADVVTTGVHSEDADVENTSFARGVADDCSTLKNLQRCCTKIDSRVSVFSAICVGDETLVDT